MDDKVLIAVIAALGSLLVSIVSLLQAIKVAKTNTKIQSEIEDLKRIEDRRREVYSKATIEAEPTEVAIEKVWVMIQTIRDEISSLIDGPSLMRDTPFELIEELVGKLSKHYRELGINFDEETREIVHEAKNASQLLLLKITEAKENIEPKDANEILQLEGVYFAETRLRLGSYQRFLFSRRGLATQERVEALLKVYKPDSSDFR
jgi:hypothetical protein